MSTYIVKRILIMVPTFFAISLIVFLIINLAPGTPGEQAMMGEGEEASGSRRETWRIFKNQFNLDKPILWNTRFTIGRDEVLANLKTAYNRDRAHPIAEQLDAIEWLEDTRRFTVPHLMAIVQDGKDPDFQAFAVRTLAENAQRQIKMTYGRKNTKALEAYNKPIFAENQVLRKRVFPKDAAPADRARILAEWQGWFNQVKAERYDNDFWDKAGIFLFETRFAGYWGKLLTFDFGVSHLDKQPVFAKVLSRLKYSLTLALPSLMLAYLISVVLGIFSAIKRNTWADKTITVILFMLYSLPTFFVGTLLLMFFSEGSDYWHWFPTGGWQSENAERLTLLKQIGDVLWHLVLPLTCMTYGSLAVLSRYARTGLLEVINADYIRTARAKGVPEFWVIVKHMVRNGMIPVITLLGTVLPILIGGSVIIEVIFNIPGMGQMTYQAILTRDYNTIMAVQLISAVLVMLGILLSDILLALVDPRISFK